MACTPGGAALPGLLGIYHQTPAVQTGSVTMRFLESKWSLRWLNRKPFVTEKMQCSTSS